MFHVTAGDSACVRVTRTELPLPNRIQLGSLPLPLFLPETEGVGIMCTSL